MPGASRWLEPCPIALPSRTRAAIAPARPLENVMRILPFLHLAGVRRAKRVRLVLREGEGNGLGRTGTVIGRESVVGSRSRQSESIVRVGSLSQYRTRLPAREECDWNCRLQLPTQTADCDCRLPTPDCRLSVCRLSSSESNYQIDPCTSWRHRVNVEIIDAVGGFAAKS